MKSILSAFAFILLLNPLQAEGQTRRYEGTIGDKHKVTIYLNFSGDEKGVEYLSAEYRYHSAEAKKDRPKTYLICTEYKDNKAKIEEKYKTKDDTVTERVWNIEVKDGGLKGKMVNTKEIPIEAKETYPKGIGGFDLRRFADSWIEEKIEEGETLKIGEGESLELLQIKGSLESLEKINRELRREAWLALQDDTKQDEGEPAKKVAPAEVSIDQLVALVKCPRPEKVDLDDCSYVADHSFSMYIETCEEDIICVSFITNVDYGGAHGVYGVRYIVFDAKTGERVDNVEKMLEKDYRKKWIELGKIQLLNDNGLGADAKLAEAGFLENDFDLSANWFITPDGVGYSYNPYEIAAYALGDVQFLLPWEKIKGDIKAGTLLEKLAKNAEKKRVGFENKND